MFAPVPAASAGTAQITVLGTGLEVCAAAHGEIESAENASVLAAGDASLHWDGVHPIPTVPLDADLGLSAILELSRTGMPGEHQVVRRCTEDTGSGGVVGIPAPESAPPVLPGRAPGQSAAPLPGQPASGDAAQADAAATSSEQPVADATRSRQADAAAMNAANHADKAVTDSLLPGSGPAPMGPVIAALLMVGAAMVVPSVIAFALQNRKGPNWVRANVRAEPITAPALIEMTPDMDYPWPTLGVRLALRPDSGTQDLTEVEQ
ncbi:MAG: hypothetical protein ACRDRV_16945 [Pseudonocardiaceae bacterium]